MCVCLKRCTFEGSFASELSVSRRKKGVCVCGEGGVGNGNEVNCGFLHAPGEQQEEGSGGGLVPGMNQRLCKCVCTGGLRVIASSKVNTEICSYRANLLTLFFLSQRGSYKDTQQVQSWSFYLK